jgi:hypothetical protein
MDERSDREGRGRGPSTADLAAAVAEPERDELRPERPGEGQTFSERQYPDPATAGRDVEREQVYARETRRREPPAGGAELRPELREGPGVVPTSPQAADAAGEGPAALLPGNEAQDFRSRWEAVQVGFVDSPREAVERADELVAGVMKRLAEVFAAERGDLESQWSRGDDVSTEDLRQALRRYRSFFDRLLSV